MSARLFSLFRGSLYQQCTTKYAHFEALLMDYDPSMECVRESGGYEAGTENKHVLYIQPDLHIKHGAYGTGYPQVNQNIQCNADGPIGNGQSSHWMVTGK